MITFGMVVFKRTKNIPEPLKRVYKNEKIYGNKAKQEKKIKYF